MAHDDLIARLKYGEGQDWDCPIEVRLEAAAALTTAQAEIEALRARVAELEGAWAKKIATLQSSAKKARDLADGFASTKGQKVDISRLAAKQLEFANTLEAIIETLGKQP